MFIQRWRRRRHEARTGERLPRDWWGVGLDFAVVVVGVGVALWAESRIGEASRLDELEALETALWSDRARNHVAALDQIGSIDCRRARINEIGEALLSGEGPWMGMGLDFGPDSPFAAFSGNIVIATNVRVWPDGTWRTIQRRGLAPLMPVSSIGDLDAVAHASKLAETGQAEALELAGGLATLARDLPELSATDRLRYHDTLALFAAKNALNDELARQIVAANGERFAQMPPEVLPFKGMDMARYNKEQRDTFGPCWQPVTLPASFGAVEDISGDAP